MNFLVLSLKECIATTVLYPKNPILFLPQSDTPKSHSDIFENLKASMATVINGGVLGLVIINARFDNC